MAQSEKELEKQLAEAGNDLLSPPSVTELLTLLDRVENALARVEQSPSESMKKALSPSMKALISDGLMRHSDVDVKVSVASCISEITRITAPDAPYEDDQMKEVFKLIVSSFEQLDDKASPSYIKRTSILETVAKVRSCVVMLDLECDDLIVEMFGCFFRSIRDDHPENVFASMETIMVLVVEESEDISFDLLSSILDVLKTENKGVLPVARQLAEKVVEKCASKLKPYLSSAVKSQCRCLDDYSKVVANACHTGQEVLEPSDGDTASKNVVGENDVADVPPEKAVEVAMETLVDAPPSEEAGPASVGSPKSIMSNGTLQKETDVSTAGNTQSKEVYNENSEAKSDDEPAKTEADPTKTDDVEPTKTDDAEPTKTDDAEPTKTDDTEPTKTDDAEPTKTHDAEPTKADTEPTKTDADSLGVEEQIKSQSKPVKSSKRKGRKTSVLKGSSEPSECSQADDEMEVIKEPEDEEKDSKEVDCANIEEPVTNATGSKEKEKEADAPVSSQKMSDNVGADIPSPSCSENLSDESRSKKIGRGNKEDSVHLNETKGDGDNKKESNVKNTSEVSETKSQKRSAKKASSASEKEDKIVADVDALNEEDETMEVDAKPVKKSGKKGEIDSSQREYKKSKDETKEVDAKPAKKSGKKVEIDSSQREDKNKGQVKGTPAKDTAKTPSKSPGKKFTPKTSGTSTKDESDVEKTVKASSKRKRSPDEEKASKTKEYGADLVGTKVKVWWPHDKKYYVGVVKSFDDVKKKHKIIYNDGDVEVLKLAKEKWEIVSDEHCADEISSSDEGPEDSTEMPKSKKVKASAEQRSKQGGKSGSSSKKGDVSSNKSKATPKSGGKKKDDSKSDGKSKVESSKSGGKLDEDKGGKSKDTKTGKKSSYETPKSGAKPKDDDDDEDEEKIIKGSNKSKQGTPKVAAKSKSKSSKSGSKSSTNGSGKVKAVLKDLEDEDEDSDDDMLLVPAKTSEASKGNSSSNTSKSSQKSQSAKKRKRSAKN